MKSVAVVEDNEDNRLVLEVFLADFYRLTYYENGPDALAGLNQLVPDLVLMDISLPGMDGVEVLSRMRNTPTLSTIPVIALTAHAMAGDKERYLAAGFSSYVGKPIVDDTVLIGEIERLLHSSA